MLRASVVPIIRSYQLYTWQLVCFMQVMWPLPRRVRLEPDSPRQLPHKFWILDASCLLFIQSLVLGSDILSSMSLTVSVLMSAWVQGKFRIGNQI
jgi:hypothetical protein